MGTAVAVAEGVDPTRPCCVAGGPCPAPSVPTRSGCFFELAARALRAVPGTEPLRDRLVEPWLEVSAGAAEQLVVGSRPRPEGDPGRRRHRPRPATRPARQLARRERSTGPASTLRGNVVSLFGGVVDGGEVGADLVGAGMPRSVYRVRACW
jgi:hypothetical protein